MTAPIQPERRGLGGTLADIYHERTNFDFIGRSWIWAIVSGALIAVSLIALGWSGLNLGIDFEGGTQWQFNLASGRASTTEVREVLDSVGVADAKVLILGEQGVRVQAQEAARAEQDRVTEALAGYGKIPASEVSVDDVGPTWGDRVSSRALLALGAFFVLIAAYLTFRFEWEMALAALVAVVHDIIITAGVYSVTGFEVTPATVVALLTILGFSLYDTVVVFDKVQENTPGLGGDRGDTYSRMVNRSMNQVLMRSINTSFVALLPVASLLIVGSGLLGAVTLRDFALALFVGLAAGAYSSIFVATPILAWLKERQPRYRAVRERSMTQIARDAAAGTQARDAAAGTQARDAVMAVPEIAPGGSARAPHPEPPARPTLRPGGITPRPRQQRRRKRR